MRAARAFTLLEVMVAVAILGLALTVILSAQAGLYTSSTYAQRLSAATGLARCKMSEVEERLLKLGYPYADENDEGPCCNADSRPDFSCAWKVERVELPSAQLASGGGDGGLAGLTGPGAAASAGAALGLGGGAAPAGTSSISGLLALASNPAAAIGDGGLGTLTGTLGANGLSGTDAIAPLVMQFVYPQLKPLLETSIRKVTVTVTWREGLRSRDLEVVQYVTNPMRVAPPPGASGSASPFGLPGSTTLPPGAPTGGALTPPVLGK